MEFDTVARFPDRVIVDDLLSSRYPEGVRPASWDQRKEGVDVIRTADGKIFRLFGDGGQSPPKRGWVIMIEGGEPKTGYTWTLYGLRSAAG